MSATEILLERETANDESALIVAVFVASGSPVEIDTLLFETENSKATQEVRAPSAGILSHALEVGQNVAFGVPIAQISAAGDASQAATVKPSLPALPRPTAPTVPVNGHCEQRAAGRCGPRPYNCDGCRTRCFGHCGPLRNAGRAPGVASRHDGTARRASRLPRRRAVAGGARALSVGV